MTTPTRRLFDWISDSDTRTWTAIGCVWILAFALLAAISLVIGLAA